MPIAGVFGRKKIPAIGEKDEKDSMKGAKFKLNGINVVVQSKLAEGGFAVVYKVVTDDKRARTLALKRQYVNEDDQRQVTAVRRECDIVRSLGKHKNIVSFLAAVQRQHAPGVRECLLLTEYYATGVLSLMNAHLQRNEWLSLTEVLAIMCDMCEAVGCLHHASPPIVHRDLKVENILIDDRTQPVHYILCDFGSATDEVLSTSLQGAAYVEDEIHRYTTLSYRAPEMIDHYSGKEIHTPADIWALGVMLYKLCYFTLPFGESTLAIQNGTFTFPTTPDFPRELHALIRYMLEPDYTQRPDIHQVAAIAFRLTGRQSPVPNKTRTPTVNELMKRLEAHERGETLAPINNNVVEDRAPLMFVEKLTPDRQSAELVPTSVLPRERPKPTTPLTARRTEVVETVPQPSNDASAAAYGFTDLHVQACLTTADTTITSFTAPVATSSVGGRFQRTMSGSSSTSSHRRNYSDTTGIKLSQGTSSGASTDVVDTSGYHPIMQSSDSQLQQSSAGGHAFKPYVPTHEAVVAAIDAAVAPDFTDSPSAPSTRSSTREPPPCFPYFPPANEFDSRAQSAIDLRHSQRTHQSSHQIVNQYHQQAPQRSAQQVSQQRAPKMDWNPFEAAPFAPSPSRQRDDSFGEQFDKLPRANYVAQPPRHDSISSQRLHMASIVESDPFGAAPFRPSSTHSENTRKATTSSQLTLQPSTDEGGSVGKPTPTSSLHEGLHQAAQVPSTPPRDNDEADEGAKVLVSRTRYRVLDDSNVSDVDAVAAPPTQRTCAEERDECATSDGECVVIDDSPTSSSSTSPNSVRHRRQRRRLSKQLPQSVLNTLANPDVNSSDDGSARRGDRAHADTTTTSHSDDDAPDAEHAQPLIDSDVEKATVERTLTQVRMEQKTAISSHKSIQGAPQPVATESVTPEKSTRNTTTTPSYRKHTATPTTSIARSRPTNNVTTSMEIMSDPFGTASFAKSAELAIKAGIDQARLERHIDVRPSIKSEQKRESSNEAQYYSNGSDTKERTPNKKSVKSSKHKANKDTDDDERLLLSDRGSNAIAVEPTITPSKNTKARRATKNTVVDASSSFVNSSFQADASVDG